MEKKKRGFAAMSKEKHQEIASLGGKAVPKEKRSFSTNKSLASKSGSKGGRSVANEDRSFSRDPELAAAAGRKGGSKTGKKRAAAKTLAV